MKKLGLLPVGVVRSDPLVSVRVPGKRWPGTSFRIAGKTYVKVKEYLPDTDQSRCVLKVSKAREMMREHGYDPASAKDPQPAT